jgi:prevent-host-death family protein
MCYILCVMERVGVRELRQNLSVYLRRVRRGESLEVTERGEPVAVLQPTSSAGDPLAALVARGIAVRRGTGNLVDLDAPVPVDVDLSASEALQELREDRL